MFERDDRSWVLATYSAKSSKLTAKRKVWGALAAGALTAGMVIGGAAPANAINRMECASHTLNLISSKTTCWGNAGYTSVTLYGVYSLSSGNNAGYLQGSGGTTYFSKYISKSIPYQTISAISIS